MRRIEKSRNKIERITIPDEAIKDWVKTLLDGGFTMAEIEPIIEKLNQNYRNFDEKAVDAVCDALADWFENEANKLPDEPQFPGQEEALERIRVNLMKAIEEEQKKSEETNK